MKTVLRLFVLTLCSVFFTSCIQHSTVLRVRKDGSGEIFVRNHFSPAIAAMAGGLAAGAGGEGGGVTIEGNADPAKPDVESLKAAASAFGEGVRYVRHEENKSKANWDGYLAVYEFDDINNVKLAMSNALGDQEIPGAEGGEPAEGEGEITFSQADGVLTIQTGAGDEAIDSFKDGGFGGGDLGGGGKPSEGMAMAAQMLSGMRMGFFVRIDGGIAETNATHVNGNFITLVDMDVAKTMSDPEMIAFVDAAAEAPDTVTEEKVKEVMGQVEGLSAELQGEVTVKFQ